MYLLIIYREGQGANRLVTQRRKLTSRSMNVGSWYCSKIYAKLGHVCPSFGEGFDLQRDETSTVNLLRIYMCVVAELCTRIMDQGLVSVRQSASSTVASYSYSSPSHTHSLLQCHLDSSLLTLRNAYLILVHFFVKLNDCLLWYSKCRLRLAQCISGVCYTCVFRQILTDIQNSEFHKFCITSGISIENSTGRSGSSRF
jgi:hypothetical protein